MKKKIIITGISGFICSHLAEHLRRKYKIIGIDREAPGIIHQDIEFFGQDINEPLPDIDNVYAVIHLAAKAGVRESQEKFGQYVKDNILGTKSILDKCVNNWKPEKILIASSSSIYGERHNNEYYPKSLYAMSKVATEMIAESYRNSKLLPDTQICCMRIFTVYGPRQRNGLAIGNFINNILQDKPITVYGDGTQKRDFTYIDDLCKAIDCLLYDDRIPYTTDIGSGNTVSLNYVIYRISKLLNKEVTIRYEDWDTQDVYETKSNSNKWFPDNPTPLVEGLKKQIEWTKRKMDKK